MTKVYIIVLNWNGWKDTIECLESVFRLEHGNYQVLVCDNNSSDNSLEYIKDWAEGRHNNTVLPSSPLFHLTDPPILKPIPYVLYDRSDIECGRIGEDSDLPLILIQTSGNLGFAGGNNVGLRYALARGDFEYIWLLNNDTVVEPGSLGALIRTSVSYEGSGRKVGMICSKVKYYQCPDIFQGVGGTYNKWFATTKHIGQFERDEYQYDNDTITEKIDYPIGASIFAVKRFIEDVGPMCEDYFLYYEEIDWTLRGEALGWQLGYCWESTTFHKEGGSAGSSSIGSEKSYLSDYFSLKNRITVTRKFFPNLLWSVRLGFLAVLFNRVRRGQFERVGLVLRTLLGKAGHPQASLLKFL